MTLSGTVSTLPTNYRKLSEESLRQSELRHRQAAAFNQRLVDEVNHRVRNNLAGTVLLNYPPTGVDHTIEFNITTHNHR
jgi:hypothetical protein